MRDEFIAPAAYLQFGKTARLARPAIILIMMIEAQPNQVREPMIAVPPIEMGDLTTTFVGMIFEKDAQATAAPDQHRHLRRDVARQMGTARHSVLFLALESSTVQGQIRLMPWRRWHREARVDAERQTIPRAELFRD